MSNQHKIDHITKDISAAANCDLWYCIKDRFRKKYRRNLAESIKSMNIIIIQSREEDSSTLMVEGSPFCTWSKLDIKTRNDQFHTNISGEILLKFF